MGSGAPPGFTEDEPRQRGWAKGGIADALAWPCLSGPLTWAGLPLWGSRPLLLAGEPLAQPPFPPLNPPK